MITHATQWNATLMCENVLYFASTLHTNKFPLHPSNYTFKKKLSNDIDTVRVGRETVSLRLNAAQDGLMTFGIWGRVYTKDVDHTTVVTERDIAKDKEHEDKIFELRRPSEVQRKG